MEPTLAAMQDDELAEAAILVDLVMLKAVGANLESQLLVVERHLFNAVRDAFLERALDAFDSLDALDIDGAITDAEIARMLRHLTEPFKGLDAELKPEIQAALGQLWRLSKEQIAARLNGDLGPLSPPGQPHFVKKAKLEVEPSFSLEDKRAVQQMAKTQTAWIGQHVGSDMSERMKELVEEQSIRTGLSRREVAQAMRDMLQREFGIGADGIPSSWVGAEAHYFEGVVGNIATTARVHGAIRQMQEVGVTHYEIVNPDDERTCERCRYMDGRTFEIEHAVNRINAMAETSTPDEVRAAHPWPKSRDALERADKQGLLGALFPLPTYHLRCRCTVDVSEYSTFELVPGNPEPVPKRVSKSYSPLELAYSNSSLMEIVEA